MSVVVRIMGGLGNQLFQYSLALALARSGAEVFLEPRFRRERYKREYALDFLSVRLPVANFARRFLARPKSDSRLARRLFRMPEPLFVQDEDNWMQFVDSPPAHALFHGHWQSAMLAAKTPELVAELQKARDALPPPPEMKDGPPHIAVHARRLWEYDARGGKVNKKGEFVFLPLKYYQNAFAAMREKFDNPRFLIFGDSPKWCRENLLPLAGKDGAVMPPDKRPDWQDMLIMAKCQGCIISNSTFSWWAAKTGGGQTTAPKQWSNSPARNAAIYPPEWEVL